MGARIPRRRRTRPPRDFEPVVHAVAVGVGEARRRAVHVRLKRVGEAVAVGVAGCVGHQIDVGRRGRGAAPREPARRKAPPMQPGGVAAVAREQVRRRVVRRLHAEFDERAQRVDRHSDESRQAGRRHELRTAPEQEEVERGRKGRGARRDHKAVAPRRRRRSRPARRGVKPRAGRRGEIRVRRRGTATWDHVHDVGLRPAVARERAGKEVGRTGRRERGERHLDNRRVVGRHGHAHHTDSVVGKAMQAEGRGKHRDQRQSRHTSVYVHGKPLSCGQPSQSDPGATLGGMVYMIPNAPR